MTVDIIRSHWKRRTPRLTLAVLLALTTAPVHAQSITRQPLPRATYSIPHSGTRVPLLAATRPLIVLTINNRGPFRMLIETGSPISYLVPAAYSKAFRTDTARRTDTFRIGDATLTGITIHRNGSIGLAGIDGLLGLDALAGAAITIDFPANELRIERDTLPAANGRDIITLGRVAQFWKVPTLLGDRTVNAILDTQSALSISAAPSRAAFLSLTTPPVAVGRARGPTIGNVIVHRARLAGSARIGDAELQQPLIDLLPLPAPLPRDAWILGLQVLTEFAVTLDQRVGRARFARENRVIAAPPPAYATGLGVTQRSDGTRVVVSVLENTPAAEAGLKAGDVILRVSDRASAEFGDVEWRETVGGRVPVQLRVSRNGVERDLTLTPRFLGF
jgi:hypothetical protein